MFEAVAGAPVHLPKETRSAAEVAGQSATGQETNDSFRYSKGVTQAPHTPTQPHYLSGGQFARVNRAGRPLFRLRNVRSANRERLPAQAPQAPTR